MTNVKCQYPEFFSCKLRSNVGTTVWRITPKVTYILSYVPINVNSNVIICLHLQPNLCQHRSAGTNSSTFQTCSYVYREIHCPNYQNLLCHNANKEFFLLVILNFYASIGFVVIALRVMGRDRDCQCASILASRMLVSASRRSLFY